MNRHRTMMLLIAAVAAITAVTAAPAAAQATGDGEPLVALEKDTPISEHDGWILFSRWDGEAYRLSVWHDGQARGLAVPPQSEPFDADAGPDADGRPSAVVSICDESCDLYVIGFDPGDELRPVRNANTDGHDEIAPAVWEGRLVFGRRYGRDQVVPYTKLLRAPRSRPSDRLAGLPDRRCGAVEPPDCRPIEDVDLRGMDLEGRWVAQSWTYQPEGFAGTRQNEIRLTDVERTDTRQLHRVTSSLGGQTFLGPAIADGKVAWFVSCQADPNGCSSRAAGAIRYDISDRGFDIAGANEQWSAWTWDGEAAYHVPSDYDCAGGDPGVPVEPCAILRRTGLEWKEVDV